ncbi:MAG: undecaprenyl-diphosphate phosphatase [Desulfobacteraceae bacterium]|nr:undecaprenyl-diphosphate phosphatase [Desulfobacteraceae bacterium]
MVAHVLRFARRMPGRFHGLALALLLLACAAPALAREAAPAPARSLTYADSVILGVVEGITEFLPVSSTGHLILADHFLGLDDSTPVASAHGRSQAEIAPGPAVMTVKEATDAYLIVIQFGAIAAVLIICWGRVRSVLMGVLGKDRRGLLLARNLLVAFVPAVVIGLLLEKLIDRYLFNTWPVIAAAFAGGLLILAAEGWRARRHPSADAGPDLHELSVGQSLMIGLLQCVAMWPGTSRSMMTMIGGYLAGLSPVRSAEFSFLLGLITLGAASCYKALKAGPAMLHIFAPGPLLLGLVVATVFAAIAVKWMVGYLGRHGMGVFAWYRMALALVMLVLM